MSIPEHQIQNSQAWHEHRRTRGNASETASLMECSPFFPRNAYELWLVKTGRREVYENEAMRRGSRLEEPARRFLESRLGEAFSPDVCEHGRLSASLDGINFEGTVALEIKVPYKGRESHTWQYVEDNGKPPIHYWWQVQHQLLCAGADIAIFAVCEADEDENIIDAIETGVEADKHAQQEIMEAWDDFFCCLDNDEPPVGAWVKRDDDEWVEAADAYVYAKERETKARAKLEEARKRLIELSGESCAYGHGVKVQHVHTKGSIDYKAAVPEGVDLEQYRKPGRWQTRIDLEKDS